MRYEAILLCIGLLFGCGGQPSAGQIHWQPMPDGYGVYELRYNPSSSLIDRPELGVEIPAGHGWERIALTGTDDDREIVDQL